MKDKKKRSKSTKKNLRGKDKRTNKSSKKSEVDISEGRLAEMNYGNTPSKTSTKAGFSVGSGAHSSGSSTLLTPSSQNLDK